MSFLIGLLVWASVASAPKPALDLEFPALNRQFQGQLPATAWEGAGVAATVTIPDFAVDLHRHRLTLTHVAGESCCRASLEAELAGRGTAVVAVDDTAIELSDEVVAPRQTLRFDGRLAIELAPDGAVTLILVEGPQVVSARVESRLGDSLGTLCSLMLGPAPCASLAVRLGRAEAAGPPPGTRLSLPAGTLDQVTLARLRVLLGDGVSP